MVTGAAGGMGRRVARAFVDLGASVVLADSDPRSLADLVEELGVAGDADRARAVRLDVTDDAAVEQVFTELDAGYGRIDHLVTCAAVITAARTPQITPEHWQRVLGINLIGTFAVCQRALARMTEQGNGNIVAIASDAGKHGGGGLIADVAYAASKAGVLSMVKSLAREYAGRGVSINALTPGPTDTPMHSGISDDLKRRIAAGLPIGRMGHPDDMAAAVMFLCSPAAKFVYGASLNVDGGALFE
jgi:3-oxoacyl-[acyl-carrier protein] reductase